MTDQKHTEFAMAAVDFASLFNEVFGKKTLSGCQVQLTAPEGPSTGGGIQALQHITLVNEAEDRTIVVGGCNNIEKKAELRHFDLVAGQYQKRFGADFPVDRTEYNQFQNKLADFFKNQLMQVSLSQAHAPSPPEPPQKGSSGLVLGIIVSLAVAALILAYLFVFQD